MPTTFGQEIKAFGTTIHYDVESVEGKGAVSVFQVTNLRGTAICTEIAADPNLTQVGVQELSVVPGFARTLTDDLTKASSNTASMLLMSGILRRGPPYSFGGLQRVAALRLRSLWWLARD